ncbi:MAG: BMP family ABC transporter substrate-binding protein [Spirochaetales bacterium]|nr:BMP family ABC transporter substrate-binding protein [Spirochaetales bacterium]
MMGMLLAVMALGFAGGGSQAATPAAEGTVSIAMVTDVGGINDQSFNQSAWEGLQRAQSELGVKVSYVESNQSADYPRNLETLVDSNNDLIWGIGFLMGDVLLAEAQNNPTQKYAIIDVAYADTPSNLIGVVFREQEPSFLVGYIAGKMTESNKVGFVGGVKFALIEKFEYGFRAGVASANPDAEVYVQYAESFTDAAAGKAIATQFYQQGADIVFHAAGGVGDGVIEAAREQGRWAIGVDRDQNDLAPENVLTSAMKRVDNAMFNVAKELAAGRFAGGTTVEYGLAEGGVGIAPSSNKHVPADILAEVQQIENRITTGALQVPFDMATFEAFMAAQ